MADKDKGYDFSGLTNPKRPIQEAEDEIMDGKHGRDAGELPSGKPTMSQPQFSGYKDGKPPRKSGGPPAAMLRKRASKD